MHFELTVAKPNRRSFWAKSSTEQVGKTRKGKRRRRGKSSGRKRKGTGWDLAQLAGKKNKSSIDPTSLSLSSVVLKKREEKLVKTKEKGVKKRKKSKTRDRSSTEPSIDAHSRPIDSLWGDEAKDTKESHHQRLHNAASRQRLHPCTDACITYIFPFFFFCLFQFLILLTTL